MPRRSRRLTLLATAVLLVFATSSLFAPSIPCPNCSFKTARLTVGMTTSEMVRVCLVGVATQPDSAAIEWEINFFDADGRTLLNKRTRVPQEGFRCVDTTAEELRSAGLEPEASGRFQFGLQITSEWDAVRFFPTTQPEKLSLSSDTYHSVETIDLLSHVTTSSHRFLLGAVSRQDRQRESS